MEAIGIILLVSIMVMGCVIFYLFLQFYRIARETQEANQRIQEGLEKLSRKVDSLVSQGDKQDT